MTRRTRSRVRPTSVWSTEDAERAEWLHGEMVLDDGTRWKDHMTDWQREAFASMLGLPGAPSGKKHQIWMEGPTGCGKDQLIAAVVLAVLHFAPEGFEVLCYSSDRERNADVIKTVRGFIRRTDDVSQDEGLGRWMGEGVTFTRTEIRKSDREITVFVEALDGASASGSRADLYLCNEVQSWPDPDGPRVYDEAIARYDKKTHGRFVVLSNAPFSPHGDFRRDEREAARSKRRKNPWHWIGVRLEDCPWWTPEKIERKKETLRNKPHVWRRLYLCQPTDGRGELVTPQVARAAETSDHRPTIEPVPGVRYIHALDVGVTRDHLVHLILHRDKEGRIWLDRMNVRVPDGGQIDLEDVRELVDLEMRQFRGKLFADPYQAVHMLQMLERSGHEVQQVPFTPINLHEMCEAVRSAFNDRRLILWKDAGLVTVATGVSTTLVQQVLEAEVQETERGERIKSRRGQAGHGDQLSALALALWGLGREGISGEVVTFSSRRSDASRDGVSTEARGVDRLRRLRSRHSGRFTGPRPTRRRDRCAS